ncbi:MAG TPA: DUF4010 domain-containing protein [Candidatus Saccharimonadales bacterium]|nr:DUF4010 domain-containing protein [Candidatus Saccharimonadales bacterium]
MTLFDLFARLGLALAIGLLFGVERGWQEREGKSGSRVAGIRTFALIGLLGGTWGLLAQTAGEVVLGLGALGFAGWFGYFEWRKEEEEGSRSATGFVAGLLAFALGGYAVMGSKAAAGGVAVAATFILSQRQALHAFLERLKWVELRAALLLLVMSFVLLPVLPNHTIDPWNTLNPHQLWILTILSASISYAGYLAVKVAGARNGLLFAGAVGGLVSSTTVTWTFARAVRQNLYGFREASAGIVASWAVSLIRIAVLATVLAPSLLHPLGIPAAGAAAVFVAGGAILYRFAVSDSADAKLALSDPFDLWMILRFTAVLAVIMVAAEWLSHLYGPSGLFGLAAISGLADVDPITLSTAEAVGTKLTDAYGGAVILVAAGSNLIAKCVLAAVFGGFRFSVPLLATGAVAAIVAVALFAVYPAIG